MLTLTTDDNKSTCFKFIGSETAPKAVHLISDNTSLITADSDAGMDTCSFYSGPSDAAIMTFAESCETSGSIAYFGGGESCGSIAYSGGGESCGSIAYSGGGESCGSIASSFSGSASVSVSTGSFGGGCSYSC